MTTPKSTVWKIEPHTQAKHEILRRYLGAWFGILGQKVPRVVYIDGFCGPGEYEGGEPGSPLIALQQAKPHAAKHINTEFVFIFIDEREDRIENLQNQIQKEDYPSNMKIFPLVGTFENEITQLFVWLDERGVGLAPTFAFIDPFGFSGIPFRLVSQFLRYERVEIFINVMAESIIRFVEHPNDTIPQYIIDTFGTSQVIDALKSATNRFAALRDLYQSQLKLHARFVRYFEMRDKHNKLIYYLFFASNNRLGHQRMKEAFWKVDKHGGYSFSDGTNPNQLVLYSPDPSPDVAGLIQERFKGKTVNTTEIYEFINDETAYIESHAKKALQLLEDRQQIKVNDQKIDGRKRIRRTFPEGVTVTFL